MTELSLQQKAKNALKDAFKHFDFDKSGSIELHELGLLLCKLTASFHVLKPSDEDVYDIFKELDLNGDGKISKEEFEVLVDEVIKIIREEGEKTQ